MSGHRSDVRPWLDRGCGIRGRRPGGSEARRRRATFVAVRWLTAGVATAVLQAHLRRVLTHLAEFGEGPVDLVTASLALPTGVPTETSRGMRTTRMRCRRRWAGRRPGTLSLLQGLDQDLLHLPLRELGSLDAETACERSRG